LQRHFPVDDILFNLEIFAIKSQNGVVENYVFGPKIFGEIGEKDPQNQMQTFYPLWGHIKYESLVQFPQQILTIAKVHQIFGQFSNFRR